MSVRPFRSPLRAFSGTSLNTSADCGGHDNPICRLSTVNNLSPLPEHLASVDRYRHISALSPSLYANSQTFPRDFSHVLSARYECTWKSPSRAAYRESFLVKLSVK